MSERTFKTTKARRLSKRSKNKGYAYEFVTVEWYADHGFPAHRRKTAQHGKRGQGDVSLESMPEFWVECKHYARGGFAFRAWKQAKKAAGPRPVVVHLTENHGPHLVVVERELWMSLFKLV
ncbi:MAG: hypothetical protein U0990_09700 [Candidatus Nanopelagicales bacterium]|nr:hypothetical protein [Candidatus Nanopelagicales bacterium]